MVGLFDVYAIRSFPTQASLVHMSTHISKYNALQSNNTALNPCNIVIFTSHRPFKCIYSYGTVCHCISSLFAEDSEGRSHFP